VDESTIKSVDESTIKIEYTQVANVWRENKDRVIEEAGTEEETAQFDGSKHITKRV
jgi:hypothetical protein